MPIKPAELPMVSQPWRRNPGQLSLEQRVSGFGWGARYGGGDPGPNREQQGSRKSPISKEKGNRKSREQAKGRDKLFTGIPVCYRCGVWSHKRSECRDKIGMTNARVVESKARKLQGRVGTNPCSMTLDSGADHTVVRAVHIRG